MDMPTLVVEMLTPHFLTPSAVYGKRTETLSSLNVHGHLLPINKNSVDLGVTVSDDLKPRTHINVIAAKAHQRACLLYTSPSPRDS